jgi:hypothetical protein
MPCPARSPLLAVLPALLLAAPGPARSQAGEAAATAAPAPAASAAAAPAPTPAEAPPPRPEGRELGGHVFTPVLGLVGPFATTSFGTYLTMGYGSTTGSVTLQLPSGPPETFTGSVEYVAVGGLLAYEYAFTRGISARVLFTETIYSGTTGAAMAVMGSNARFGMSLGMTAGTTLGESVRLSAVLDASSAPQVGLLLGPALKSAYDSCSTGLANCTIDLDKLFKQNNVLQVRPGVAAGWAPLRSLGLVANVSYLYSSIDTKDAGTASQGAVTAGAAADFDFRAISSVPVGLQVSVNGLFPISGSTEQRFTDVGGAIFYTGRKDLSVGLQIVDRRFKVDPAVDVSWKTFIALIGLRYYW